MLERFLPSWMRDKNGNNFYDLTAIEDWYNYSTNLEVAENHPILTPALLFVSKLFSQADFYIENKKTKEKIYDHWLLDVLKNPNYFQTESDFLESLNFMMIAQGVAIVYKKSTLGFDEPDKLFLLNKDLIKFPDGFKDLNFLKLSNAALDKIEITYDENGVNMQIPLSKLMFFYDLPNATRKNPFKVKSRLDGLKQTLINTNDSLLAKNIILKTNGKELITGGKEGFPLGDKEKEEAQKLFNTKYGLSRTRSRSLLTRANLTWKSLHIALRDLGLDESVKVDGNLIYTALHIPKDILSLEAKKTTYNNFKESMVSYIQNEMQSTLDAFTKVIQKELKDKNLKIKGSYEHLPIMQFILIERYEGVLKRAEALRTLRESGVPDDLALDLCGFPKGTKLEELKPKTETNGQQADTKTAKLKKVN